MFDSMPAGKMFDLLHQFAQMQQLAYGNSEIEFGAQDVSNFSDASGNTGSEWNYGLAASCQKHCLLVAPFLLLGTLLQLLILTLS